MSTLEGYFNRGKRDDNDHPLIRLLVTHEGKPDFGTAQLEVRRPRAALGFEPAVMNLCFMNKEGQQYDYKSEPWDPNLNRTLVERGIRAIDGANEVARFGLGLAAAFQRPESRFGDGFFNSVLMRVIDSGPLGATDAISEIRPYISTNKPYTGGPALEDCTLMIRDVLEDRWHELRQNLTYQVDVADGVLAKALAYYLDERFTITDRRKLGWL